MKHIYTAAYKLIGATRPACDAEVVVGNFPDLHGKMSVVYEIDDHLFEIDRAAAAGTSMLKALVGQAGEVSMEDRIANEIANIREVRQFASASNVFLLYRAEGETDIWNPSTTNEFEEFVVAIDGADKSTIKRNHQKAIQGVIAAFALGSQHISGFTKIAEGVYFIDGTGKPNYSLSFGGSGKATISTTLKAETVDYAKQFSTHLANHKELTDPSRLLARSLDEESDVLLSYLSVWSALEIFINKAFRFYESEALGNPANLGIPEPIVRRIRDVMSDKYRISDRFSLVSSSLDPAGADIDLAEFSTLKKIRDRLMHGAEVPLDTLPTARTEKLLRKYLNLHVRRIANPKNQ